MTVDPTPTIVPAPTRTTRPAGPRPGRTVCGYAATTARWARSLTTDALVVVVVGVGEGTYQIGDLENHAWRGDRWAEAVLRAITGR